MGDAPSHHVQAFPFAHLLEAVVYFISNIFVAFAFDFTLPESFDMTYVGDESGDLRLGIKTGDYGSDTVVARIGKG